MGTPPPGLVTRYFDCGSSVGKESYEDYPGAGFGPLQEGCFEIDYDTYVIRLAEIRGEVGQMKAAFVAADEEAAAAAAQEAAAMPMVEGPVTDDNFPGPRKPIDGSMAVDTVSGRLYVRLGGQWRSSALV